MSAEFFSRKFWETAEVKDVQRELDNGADIMMCDEGGWTLLHMAAQYSKIPAAMVELLLKYKADPNKPDVSGWTPLHVAALTSSTPAVVELLLLGNESGIKADPSARTEDGDTPLHLAMIAENLLAMMKLLSDNRAASNTRTKLNAPPAGHRKTTKGVALAVVELLLDNGANPNARAENGDTPLHAAAKYSKTPAAVELLLDYVAKAKDKFGGTAFDYAKDNEALKRTEACQRLKWFHDSSSD